MFGVLNSHNCYLDKLTVRFVWRYICDYFSFTVFHGFSSVASSSCWRTASPVLNAAYKSPKMVFSGKRRCMWTPAPLQLNKWTSLKRDTAIPGSEQPGSVPTISHLTMPTQEINCTLTPRALRALENSSDSLCYVHCQRAHFHYSHRC